MTKALIDINNTLNKSVIQAINNAANRKIDSTTSIIPIYSAATNIITSSNLATSTTVSSVSPLADYFFKYRFCRWI